MISSASIVISLASPRLVEMNVNEKGESGRAALKSKHSCWAFCKTSNGTRVVHENKEGERARARELIKRREDGQGSGSAVRFVWLGDDL